MERVAVAVALLSDALDKYREVQPDIKALSDYYGSDLWRQDFADDEAGRLPKNLRRGVLSEDGLWNLLDECREIEAMLPLNSPDTLPSEP